MIEDNTYKQTNLIDPIWKKLYKSKENMFNIDGRTNARNILECPLNQDIIISYKMHNDKFFQLCKATIFDSFPTSGAAIWPPFRSHGHIFATKQK